MSTLPENPAPALPGNGRVLSEAQRTTANRPGAAAGILLIVRRELGTYFRNLSGYVIASLILFLNGLLFNAYAIGGPNNSQFSTDVLSNFFYFSSGMVMVAAVLISMRLIAEERQSGSLPLLTTSSLTDGQIVFAKFLSGYAFLAILILATVYMPLLIFLHGKVSVGHIVAGYVGLFALGAASMAIGTFGSAISPSQVVAVIVSGVMVVFLLVQWMLARIVDGKLSDIVSYLALHEKHFRPFMEGTVSLRDLIYYASITAFFLVLARNSLEGRRWKP